ncbi:hypothetical protein DL93DRAFT_1974042 [Clavulina sp. PMI_390]|nr:hypothetical protein DL93DRAFT_1974042 [Clavulina sp. PMI_390]
MSSSRPPSYIAKDNIHRERRERRRATYVYYRVYQDDAPRPSTLGSARKGSNGHGAIYVEDLPPACTVKSLKRSIAREEGFKATEIHQLYLSHSDNIVVDDGALFELSMGSPGSDVNKPIRVVLLDDVSHAFRPHTSITSSSSRQLSLEGLPDPLPVDLLTWWTVDATSGFGNPHIHPNDPSLITASPHMIALTIPPGWARATLSDNGFTRSQSTNPWIVFDADGFLLPYRIRKWDWVYIDCERTVARLPNPGKS